MNIHEYFMNNQFVVQPQKYCSAYLLTYVPYISSNISLFYHFYILIYLVIVLSSLCVVCQGSGDGARAVPTGQIEDVECGLIISSIGYKSIPIDPTVPFDPRKAIVPNDMGRVQDTAGERNVGMCVCPLAGSWNQKPQGKFLRQYNSFPFLHVLTKAALLKITVMVSFSTTNAAKKGGFFSNEAAKYRAKGVTLGEIEFLCILWYLWNVILSLKPLPTRANNFEVICLSLYFPTKWFCLIACVW